MGAEGYAMATTLPAPASQLRTLADLLVRLGDIPPDRVRYWPRPGTATEKDILQIRAREGRSCELVDGVLVEKAMGLREAMLALALGGFLHDFVRPRNLGIVTGPDGTLRIFPGLVRIPDVAFASWERIPGGRVPDEPIPDLVPDLAVEILSESNTPGEMALKRSEYFGAGVSVVWMIDPEARTVAVYTSPERCVRLAESQTLEGGDVLPGFALPLSDFFSELDIRRG
jgi:Uma2 family endonuclease